MWRELSLGLAGPLSAARLAQPVGWRDGRALLQPAWRAEVAGWAAAFAQLPGQHVALHFEDSLHAAAALFGAWHAGKTVWWPGDALPETAARLAERVQAFAGDWPTRADAVRAVAPTEEPAWQALDAQAEALVIFTSGSTGEPAALRKRLAQLFDEVRALESEFGQRLADGTVHGTVSHQHIYGLLFRLLWPLAAGRPIAAQRVAYIEDLAALAGPLTLIASPAHLKRLQNLPAAPRQLLAVFSSGGPLPAEALTPCFQHLGQTPIEVYGSSETGGVAWRQRAPGSQEDAAWRALPGVSWRLEGERLLLRSPHLEAGSDWFEAQDRARAEGPDAFVLLGRADRIVKIEEKRVSLAAIEAALMASGAIEALRLVLLPGRRQELGVVLVPADWTAVDAQGRAAWLALLRARLEPLLEATVRPRRWRLVSELPSNSQGKSTQAALLALFDPLRPPARVLERDAKAALLRLDVEARLPAFDGHFVGHPVLPGVVQLDWVERFGRELFAQLQPCCTGASQLKFQQVITPGLQIELRLDCAADGSELRFALSSPRGAHASGRLQFGDEGAGA